MTELYPTVEDLYYTRDRLAHIISVIMLAIASLIYGCKYLIFIVLMNTY